VTTRYPKLVEVLKHKSLKRGHFVLSSGKSSTYYIDGRITSMDPQGVTLIAEAILNEIKDLPVDAVGGMDMGATPIVGALACRSYLAGTPMPVFVVRKEVKSHGTMKLIEGQIPPAPCNVVIVDDVVTSGESILKAINAAEAHGAKVLLAISVLDRNAGATENLQKRGIPYRPLATLADLGI